MKAYIFILIVAMSLMAGTTERFASDGSLSETASPEARPHFEKGLLLLHNFEYVDAAEEFIIAQEKDPDFAMAYWGEAMTYDHPIWRDLNIEKSRAALKKLGSSSAERMSKGKTELEKDLIRSVDILFGEGSKPDREKSYSEHMGTLYKKYADNHDVAAFYALSLLALKDGWYEWEEFNVKAAEIANQVLKADPNHAGALHYLVHADDHPVYANQGLDAANRYAQVASYAGHALHMPSHIYLALGMWEDVVRANEVSWKAGVDRNERKKLNNDHLNYHAHLWLAYGYLQQGRFESARTLVDNQIRYDAELSSTKSRFHLMEMVGHYLFNTGEWDGPLAKISIETKDMDASSQYTYKFLEGYKMFQSKTSRALAKLIEDFTVELEKATVIQKESSGMTICGTTRYDNAIPTELDLKTGKRYLNELQALLAWMDKDLKAAEQAFKDALPKEGSVVAGPPYFLISPHELYGTFLLANGRAADALQQFDKALAASPNRYLALKGKLAASKASKNQEVEASVRRQLLTNLKNGDERVKKGI